MVLESVGVEITNKDYHDVIVIGVYRPPCYENVKSFFEKMYSLLSKYLHNKNKHLLMVGDFNIDLLTNNSVTERFKDLMNEFNLMQYIDSPTRVTGSSSTLIDHVICNADRRLLQVEVVGTGLSDHFGQMINFSTHTVSLNEHNVKRKTVTLRDTCIDNLNSLNFLLSKETWNLSDNNSNSSTQFTKFLNIFNYNLSLTCPLKNNNTKKKKYTKCWVTKGIRVSSQMLKELDMLKRQNKSTEFIEYYKTYKKIYRKVIKIAKSQYMYKKLNTSNNVSKDAWKIIDADRKGKPVHFPSDMPSPDCLNDYFANLGNEKQALITEPFPQSTSDVNCTSTLRLNPTDPAEIFNIIMNLKNSNSAGYDGITHRIIRHCAKLICKPLSELVNLSLEKGLFPPELKQTIIRPIFKDGSSSSPENWRPIANVSTFSKIYEHVFARRLLNFLSDHDLVCKEQFGFVHGKNTTDAMIDFSSKVISALDNKYKAVGVFLDLQKAFNCLRHDILFDRLYNLGIRGVPLDWLKSFLISRTQRVQVNGVYSNNVQINYGIPQGTVLGPIIFILYTNSITKSLNNLILTMYADDMAVLFKNNVLTDLERDSYIQLTNLFQYLNINNLHVNPSKSSCIYFSNSAQIDDHPIIIMNDFELPFQTKTRYLGLTFDKNFTWKPCIDNICSKLSSQLFLLSRFYKYNNIFIMRLIYYSLIESKLRYGIILWGSASDTALLRVFRLQKRAIRIMAGVNRRRSCREIFKSFRILTLSSLYILEMLLFYRFKSLNFQTGSTIHGYNTRYRDQHRQTSHRLELAASLPQNIGAKLFNRLPENIKILRTYQTFKTSLQRLLLDGAFYSVEEFLIE